MEYPNPGFVSDQLENEEKSNKKHEVRFKEGEIGEVDKDTKNSPTKNEEDNNEADINDVDFVALEMSESSRAKEDADDVEWYEWIMKKFKVVSGGKGYIKLKEFQEAFCIKEAFFAKRYFAIFDEDKSGTIELLELLSVLKKLRRATVEDKIHFLFKVYDVDGNGYIDEDELKTVLRYCLEENYLTLDQEAFNSMTHEFLCAVDSKKTGMVSYEDLKQALKKHPKLVESLSASAVSWTEVPKTQPKKNISMPRHLSFVYLRNNIKKIVFLVIYALITIGLSCIAAYNYWGSNACLIVARICGLNLNFNGMFVLLLMLRKSLTYLRMTFFRLLLPLDQNIFLHKMVGVVIAVQSLIHTGAHIGNAILITQSNTTTLTVVDILFTTKAGIGWVSHSAFITGWILLVVLAIMVVCSMNCVRRSGHFEVFYWTHTLYVVFWVVLILHGPVFWMWFIGPGTLFLLEKVMRSRIIKRFRYGQNTIEEIQILPSGVTKLQITSSNKFIFLPGDYVLINIPAISVHEWHPFTISSAPEMKGVFWLHIRSAGHWTKRLYQYFKDLNTNEEIENPPRKFSIYDAFKTLKWRKNSDADNIMLTEAEKRIKNNIKKVYIPCYIDGPYGTGCREVFHTEHAVLIAAGIGVTPMASILQSIMYKYKSTKRTCPNCNHQFFSENKFGTSMNIKKVDFVWINRDQKSFEWFCSLLSQMEMDQLEMQNSKIGLERFIDIHLFMTSLSGVSDMKSVGLQLAMELMHKRYQKCVITGLRTQLQAGRPNWDKLFTRINKEKRGKPHVFFCGAPVIGKAIKEKCAKFKFAFTKENF